MKKTVIFLMVFFISLSGFSQKKDTTKTFKVRFDIPTWQVYFRNIDRLNSMAGRNVSNSEELLATKDTVFWFEQAVINQLKDSTINK